MSAPDTFRRDSAMQPADPVRALQVARVTEMDQHAKTVELVEQLASALEGMVSIEGSVTIGQERERRAVALPAADAALHAYAAWSGK